MNNETSSRFHIRDEKSAGELFSSTFCLQDYKLGINKDKTRSSTSSIKSFSSVNLQSATIYKLENVGVITSNHTRRHILAELNRDFLLSVPLSHRYYVKQTAKPTVCEPGSFRLLSLSVPFFTHTSGIKPDEQSSGFVVRVSGPLLRQQLPDIDDYPDLVLKIRPGVGQIMKSLITAGIAEGEHLSPSQARDFGKMVTGAIVNAILDAPEYEMRQARVHQSSQERICEMAKDFIARNLANPMLDCAMVAMHCQVSKTYLHVAFASASLKVSAYIRELRLQQCRANLLDRKLRHRTITEIMMNWGFVDSTSFGQTYKARFGKTPREERNSLALQ